MPAKIKTKLQYDDDGRSKRKNNKQIKKRRIVKKKKILCNIKKTRPISVKKSLNISKTKLNYYFFDFSQTFLRNI